METGHSPLRRKCIRNCVSLLCMMNGKRKTTTKSMNILFMPSNLINYNIILVCQKIVDNNIVFLREVDYEDSSLESDKTQRRNMVKFQSVFQ